MSDNSADVTRIQVERVEDWQRIRERFTEAVLTTLSEKLASSSSAHVREAVTAHLLQWRDTTFESAQRNLRINGQNFEDYVEEEEETEPFDEVLDRRIWTLSVEKMQWDKELAERRREVPVQIEALLSDLIAQQRVAGQDLPAIEDHDNFVAEEARLPREDQVSELYRKVTVVHEAVEKKAPELEERQRRANTVTEDIKNLIP